MTTVRLATADQVPALAAVLASSFVDDPMVTWPFHEHDVEDRATVIFAALLSEYVKFGGIWETGDGSATAAWIPPGGFGLEAVNEATWPVVPDVTDDTGERYRRFWDWLETSIPDEPHWMLDIVGVDPARQGEGLGGALVEHGLAFARRDGLPAFLETGNVRNVPYYERFGFRVIREEDAPGGGPHIWFMRRDS